MLNSITMGWCVILFFEDTHDILPAFFSDEANSLYLCWLKNDNFQVVCNHMLVVSANLGYNALDGLIIYGDLPPIFPNISVPKLAIPWTFTVVLSSSAHNSPSWCCWHRKYHHQDQPGQFGEQRTWAAKNSSCKRRELLLVLENSVHHVIVQKATRKILAAGTLSWMNGVIECTSSRIPTVLPWNGENWRSFCLSDWMINVVIKMRQIRITPRLSFP